MNASPKILIVEDEAHMRRFLRTTLTHNGYETAEAVDGVDVVGQIREQRDVPIIIISARHYEFAKIEALDCGANDYVTKPFGAGELLARIRVALRTRGAPTTAAPQSVVVIGDLHIDLGNPIVSLRAATTNK